MRNVPPKLLWAGAILWLIVIYAPVVWYFAFMWRCNVGAKLPSAMTMATYHQTACK
jgi:hypothetical protein